MSGILWAWTSSLGERLLLEVIVDFDEDPLKNIVYEEVLFEVSRRFYREPLARVWINPRSIVIGYSLDWCEEVYCDKVLEEKIVVVRRFTGGGAVYHDLGNINISVARISGERLVGVEEIFSEATGLVSDVIRELGLLPRVENMNDVVVNGFKVSGSSAAIRSGGYFYHSTLLVSADISLLKKLIKPRIERVLRGEVSPAKYNPANISMFIDVSVRDVLDVIMRVLEKRFGYVSTRRFSGFEKEMAEKMYREKYLPKHVYKPWI